MSEDAAVPFALPYAFGVEPTESDVPDAPTNFQVTEEAATHIDVEWTDQTSGAHEHRLYIRKL